MTRTEESRSPLAIDLSPDDISVIIHEVTGKTIPSHDTDLSSLGFDSITMLDVLAMLEQRYNLTLNENTIRDFKTVNQIARILKEIMRG